MTLRIGNRRFAPRAWAVVASLLLIATFCWLGNWQLGRGREKQALMAAFERGETRSVVLGPSASTQGLPRYQRVAATGHYDPARQVLLDNMPSATGRPGFRVLTPFVRDGASRLLLVDRGWVPLGATREALPVIEVAGDARTVGGRLDGVPVPGLRVGEASPADDTAWPRVMNFPRVEDLERAFAAPIEPRILLLDAGEPDGFERQWRPSLGFGPERHVGYAIQWFALAVAVLVAFIALSVQRVDEPAPDGAP